MSQSSVKDGLFHFHNLILDILPVIITHRNFGTLSCIKEFKEMCEAVYSDLDFLDNLSIQVKHGPQPQS